MSIQPLNILSLQGVGVNPRGGPSLSAGMANTPALGPASEFLVSHAHSENFINARFGNYFVANWTGTTGVEILAAGGTTSGAVLGNRIGSGLLVDVKRIRVVPFAATVVVGAIGLEYGALPVAAPAAATVVAVTSMPVGGGGGPAAGVCWNATTIVANTYLRNLPLSFMATTDVDIAGYEFTFDGNLVIAPGTSINLMATTTTQGSIKFLVDMEWSEFPI